jgi:hypothetical protein
MLHIRLTDNLYVSADAVILIELAPGKETESAFLTLVFDNPEFSHLYLRGAIAEQAFANWEKAQEERKRNQNDK